MSGDGCLFNCSATETGVGLPGRRPALRALWRRHPRDRRGLRRWHPRLPGRGQRRQGLRGRRRLSECGQCRAPGRHGCSADCSAVRNGILVPGGRLSLRAVRQRHHRKHGKVRRRNGADEWRRVQRHLSDRTGLPVLRRRAALRALRQRNPGTRRELRRRRHREWRRLFGHLHGANQAPTATFRTDTARSAATASRTSTRPATTASAASAATIGVCACNSAADCAGGACRTVSSDGCRYDCSEIETGFTCVPGHPCFFCGNGLLERGRSLRRRQCRRRRRLLGRLPRARTGLRLPGARRRLRAVRQWYHREHRAVRRRGWPPVSGDGCSATCQLEPGYQCYVAGKPCERCGNGSQGSERVLRRWQHRQWRWVRVELHRR